MKNYIIEKEWISNGLKCIVVFQRGGYRCGYVEVPQTHPLFEKYYNNYINDSINVEIKDFSMFTVVLLFLKNFQNNLQIIIGFLASIVRIGMINLILT